MGLAPGVLMRGDVLRFGVIGRARIQRCVQVALLPPGSGALCRCELWPEWLAAVDGKAPVKGFTQAREPRHPRAAATLIRIQARAVRIGASHAEASAQFPTIAAKAAGILLQGGERMLQPGLANLLKALVVGRSAAHPIEILRNDRMVGIWYRKPIQFGHSVIAGGRSHRQADLGSATAKLLHGGQISHDDIRSRHKIRNIRSPASSRAGPTIGPRR